MPGSVQDCTLATCFSMLKGPDRHTRLQGAGRLTCTQAITGLGELALGGPELPLCWSYNVISITMTSQYVTQHVMNSGILAGIRKTPRLLPEKRLLTAGLIVGQTGTPGCRAQGGWSASEPAGTPRWS